jgi:tRNA1Val (adenine37-N6)-methyltransferase
VAQLTAEYFESVGISVRQPEAGFRYGAPTMLLTEFVRARPGQRVADLGSGCGIVAMMIAARDHPELVVAIELQRELHEIAVQNVEANGLGSLVACVHGDWRSFAKLHRRGFDLVLSNPPFHPAHRGRLSPNQQRAAAHHELSGTVYDLVVAARTLLAVGGRFALVFPEARRFELLHTAAMMGFSARRMVRGAVGPGPGPFFLVEFELNDDVQAPC